MVMKPGKHQRSKHKYSVKIYVGRSTILHNLLFCSHTLCMNYVTNTFLFFSSSVRSKQLLCFVHRPGQKREQKHITRNFDEFHNHSPLLTVLELSPQDYRTRTVATNTLTSDLRPRKLRSLEINKNI